MTQIIPIKDLKNTGAISDLCHTTDGPVYVTKNGHNDLVLMSAETFGAYETAMARQELYVKVAEAEDDVRAGRTSDFHADLAALRTKRGL